MKTTQELYISVLKEEITPKDFLYQVRKDPKLSQWITPLLSYEDSVKILKNKGIINENFDIDDDDDQSFMDDDGWDREKYPFGGKKFGPNVAYDLMQRLDKGEGDEEDEAFLRAYTGVGDDSISGRNAFSMNENIDEYSKAFNSVIDKIKDLEEKTGSSDSSDINHFIDIAVAEYDLSDEEEQNLRVDIFDYRNSEYDQSDYDLDIDTGEELEETNTLIGGKGDNLSPNSVDQNELQMGIKHEMEHTTDRNVAEEIALDHLAEDPHYYSKIKKAHLNESTSAPHILDIKKSNPKFDNIRFNQLLKGARYEYEQSNKKDWEKSYEKAGNNLLKNPLYYVEKLNNIKSSKKRNDQTIEVKNNNFKDKTNSTKIIKKDSTKQNKFKSGEKTKEPKKSKIEIMSQKPKRSTGIKYMETPGKEKKIKFLKEGLIKIVKMVLKEEIQKKKLKESEADKGGIFEKKDQIDYILQHLDVIKEPERVTREWLESQTNLYINKLYQAVKSKVQQNIDLNGQEPEFYPLTEEEEKLQEVKGLQIKPGSNFTVQADLGKFKQGENVTVINVVPKEDEIHFTLRNDKGIEDIFIIDKNDNFNEMHETNPLNEEEIPNKIGPKGVEKTKQIIINGFSNEYPINRVQKYLKNLGIHTNEQNNELIVMTKQTHGAELNKLKHKIDQTIVNSGFTGINVKLIIK